MLHASFERDLRPRLLEGAVSLSFMKSRNCTSTDWPALSLYSLCPVTPMNSIDFRVSHEDSRDETSNGILMTGITRLSIQNEDEEYLHSLVGFHAKIHCRTDMSFSTEAAGVETLLSISSFDVINIPRSFLIDDFANPGRQHMRGESASPKMRFSNRQHGCR